MLLCVSFTSVGCGDNLRHVTIRIEFDKPFITTENDVFTLFFTAENNSADFTVLYDKIPRDGITMDFKVFYYDDKYGDVYYPPTTVFYMTDANLSFTPSEDEYDVPKKNWKGPVLECGKYHFCIKIDKSAKEKYSIKPFTVNLYITVI